MQNLSFCSMQNIESMGPHVGTMLISSIDIEERLGSSGSINAEQK